MTNAFAYQDGTSAASRGSVLTQSGADPRRRRFGINPSIWQMVMPCRDSGQQVEVIPSGLVTFRTDTIKVENYEDVLQVPEGEFQKEIYREFTAQWFLNNTKIRWASHAFRELPSIMVLDDPELNKDGSVNQRVFPHSAQGYFATVHPSLQCEREGGVKECVTCRLRSLGTTEQCPEELWKQMSRLPRPDIAEQLRLELIETYEARLEVCRVRWDELKSEVKGRERGEPGISRIDESGHFVRRHLHAAEESEAATAAVYGQQVAEKQVEGFKTLANAMQNAKGNDTLTELLARVVEKQEKQDEVLAELLKDRKKPAKKADVETAD